MQPIWLSLTLSFKNHIPICDFLYLGAGMAPFQLLIIPLHLSLGHLLPVRPFPNGTIAAAGVLPNSVLWVTVNQWSQWLDRQFEIDPIASSTMEATCSINRLQLCATASSTPLIPYQVEMTSLLRRQWVECKVPLQVISWNSVKQLPMVFEPLIFFSAAPATVTSCPFQGLHRMIHYKQPECQGYIQSGCNGTSTMEVYSPCSSQPRK